MSQEGRITFGALESGDDAFSDAAPVAMNVLFDGKSAMRRRPGLRAFVDAPSTAISSYPITGIYRTLRGDLIATDDELGHRRIYRVSSGGAVDISNPAQADLRGTKRPVFAETEALLAIAGGKEIQKLTLTTVGTPSARLGGSPPEASHVIFNSSRFLVNRVVTPLDQIQFSDPVTGEGVTPLETWSGTLSSGSFKAEARADRVVAIAETMNDVWAFGATTTQLFVPDPHLGYARALQTERGCIAPYTVTALGDAFAWMDDEKQIVYGSAREQQAISGPIQQTLDRMTTVDDGWGFRFKGDQFEAAVFPFETDGRAFCFQMAGGWSQWQSWDGEVWGKINIASCHLHRGTKATIVGTRDGKIAELTTAAADDLGSRIRVLCQSGFKSRATDKRKACEVVRLAFQRPNYSSSTTTQVRLRYRNEDGAWRHPILLTLDAKTKIITLRSLGVYRRRQWEIDYEAAEDVILSSATEEYTVLED